MPILQWLFKGNNNNNHHHCSRKQHDREVVVEEAKSRDLVLFDELSTTTEEESKSTFTVLLKREDSRACFYSTLQLKQLKSLNNLWRQQSDHQGSGGLVRIMGHKSIESSTGGVGCKILPICDVASLGGWDHGVEKEGGEQKSDKRRAVSKMKELLRWAAAAKSRKGGRWKVLYFRNKSAIKDPLDDARSINSSKISFRWDVGSCSTSSSVYSPMSLPPASRGGDQMWTKNVTTSAVNVQSLDNITNFAQSSAETEVCNRASQWITTDSDFVVLEL